MSPAKLIHCVALSGMMSGVLCLMAACSGNNGHFRIEGSFKNINQGELYIYSLNTGHLDTVHLSDGRFAYDVALHDTVTYSIVFPNYSEIPVFAQPGQNVKVVGDVSHLKESEVKGSEDNELMTAFRLHVNDLMPPEVKKAATAFVKEHPASPVSLYLVNKYFILQPEPDYEQAVQLTALIQKNTPKEAPAHAYLTQLSAQLKALKGNTLKSRLPRFSATDTEGHRVTNDDLKADVNIVCSWASWSYESQNILRRLKQLQRENPGRIAVVSVQLDVMDYDAKSFLQRDTLKWPNICDGEQWSGRTVSQLGITDIPQTIVTDHSGIIVARNLKVVDLEKKVHEMIGKK